MSSNKHHISTSNTDEESGARPPRLNLAQALKTGTAFVHIRAEQVHFLRNFFKGEIHHDMYGRFLLSLYHLYAHLEALLNVHGPVHFATCHFPRELQRTQALTEDLDFWLGVSAKAIPPPTPAVQDYLNRLDDIAKHNPLLLLAHSYTRYLGDLSGGKILGRVAKRALHVNDTASGGLDFFNFEHVPSAKRFKDEYKRAMNALDLTNEQIQTLVAEANVAFMLNVRLFQELDVQARVPGAHVLPLHDALAFADPNYVPPEISKFNPNSSTSTSSSSTCPFIMSTAAATAKASSCPWPFCVLHSDPTKFNQEWKTGWILLIGMVLWWSMWTWQTSGKTTSIA